MRALILPKLGMCKDGWDAIKKLEEMGARRIGSGYFSYVYKVEQYEDIMMAQRFDVFRHQAFDVTAPYPNKIEITSRIVKVAVEPDHGGLIAAKAAMLTKDYDDLAPRYYGVTEFGGGHWMGELEVLKPQDGPRFPESPFQHSAPVQPLMSTTEQRQPNPTLRSTSLYVRTLWDMLGRHGTGRWDLHRDNIMMRGDQPVITDPLAI